MLSSWWPSTVRCSWSMMSAACLGFCPTKPFLRGLLPAYVQAQQLLAGVLDEHSAEMLFSNAQERKVEELLTVEDIPLVQVEDSLIEVPSVMVRTRSPLVAVLEGKRIVGGITVADLLAQLAR